LLEEVQKEKRTKEEEKLRNMRKGKLKFGNLLIKIEE